MGCGCGGGKNYNTKKGAVAPQSTAAGRRVQVQANQRQALVQQAKERINQVSGKTPAPTEMTIAQREVERKRKIQVRLRNKTRGN
jgi:hypothetical protein